MHCLGCGGDLSLLASKDRRNIGSESSAAPEPRECVLKLWTILLKQKLQDLDFSFENIFIDPSNPGKMCRSCYSSYEKCATLQNKLSSNLQAVLDKITSTSRTPCTRASSRPTKKRRLDYEEGISHTGKTVASPISLPSSTTSPQVSVCIYISA